MHHYAPYINWIDSQEKTLLERIRKWSSVNTFSFNQTGLSQLSEILSENFKVLGGEISLIQLPKRKILSADGLLSSQPLGQALVIRKRPQEEAQILLGGHYDTVFEPTSPFQSVQEREDGIWIGPGIADMKGGLAILLTALEAVERSPFAQRLGWEIIITPDEEIGSPGSAPLFKAAAKRHQAALLFEPSFPDGAFVSDRKGSASYTVLVRGRAAHAGRDFEKGRSAVFALARFITKLETLQQGKELTINVASLEGYGPVNIVPPLASCRVNIRSTHANSLDETGIQMQNIAQEIQQEGIKFEFLLDSFRPPKPFNTEVRSLFKAYGACAAELKLPFSYRSSGGVCDGNLLAEAGLPTIDTAGAIGGALHTFDEYVILSSLVERSKLAALFLLKFANRNIILTKENPHD